MCDTQRRKALSLARPCSRGINLLEAWGLVHSDQLRNLLLAEGNPGEAGALEVEEEGEGHGGEEHEVKGECTPEAEGGMGGQRRGGGPDP